MGGKCEYGISQSKMLQKNPPNIWFKNRIDETNRRFNKHSNGIPQPQNG